MVIARALAAPGVTPANHASLRCVAFHYLTTGMVNQIIYRNWQITRWALEIRAGDIAPFCLVLILDGWRKEKCNIIVAPQVSH